MDWTYFITAILYGLAVVIPLTTKLIMYVKKSVREKNWNALLSLIMELMKNAEQMFKDGASRKEWVLKEIEVSASTINYDIDMELVSDLIDSLCYFSKSVNAPNG